ncbi:cytochrome C [Thiocapsa sp.]|uniref:cytochrome C n=1 Tax=Thiocapsa sp. TaxID=2024551 RepID=UPI003593B49A
MYQHQKVLSILVIGVFALGAAGAAFGDDDDDDDDDRRGNRSEQSQPRADFAPVTNAAYGEECGSCHMAYQPDLLPARAWAEVMSPEGLSNHYGDDASLTDALRNEITAYLTANAADRSGAKRASKFAESRAGADGGLPRISANPYFVKEHDEIPARLIKDNPDVGSLSKCNACHRGAAEGDYSEQRINIPGHGPWKD